MCVKFGFVIPYLILVTVVSHYILWTKWNLCVCVQRTCLRQWCCLPAACRLCWSRRWSCRGSAASTTTQRWTVDWTRCPCCWIMPAAGKNPHIPYCTRTPPSLIKTLLCFKRIWYTVHLVLSRSAGLNMLSFKLQSGRLSDTLYVMFYIHYEAGCLPVCVCVSLGNSSLATLSRSSLSTVMKSGSASSPTTAQNWQPGPKTPQSLCGMLTR